MNAGAWWGKQIVVSPKLVKKPVLKSSPTRRASRIFEKLWDTEKLTRMPIAWPTTSIDIISKWKLDGSKWLDCTVKITSGLIFWLLSPPDREFKFFLESFKFMNARTPQTIDTIIAQDFSGMILPKVIAKIDDIFSLSCFQSIDQHFKKKFWYPEQLSHYRWNNSANEYEYFWMYSLVRFWMYEIISIASEEIPDDKDTRGNIVKRDIQKRLGKISLEIFEVREFISRVGKTIRSSKKPFDSIVPTEEPWQLQSKHKPMPPEEQQKLAVSMNWILEALREIEKKWSNYTPEHPNQYELLQRELSNE